MVKRSVLDRFVRHGGYDIVERKEGKWKNISEVSKKTGLSRPTIYRLLAEHPKPSRSHVWMTREDYEQLGESYLRLKGAEKLLKEVQEYFKRSLIVDLGELRARQELQGMSLESFQLALKKQVEAGEKRRSVMEKVLDNAVREVYSALADFRTLIH